MSIFIKLKNVVEINVSFCYIIYSKGSDSMASSMIHIAVANELNKRLACDKSKLLIGSIAPDISKQLGETKLKTHFLDNEESNIPNIDKFISKYKHKLNDDFVLGYYIHLYTDYLWHKYFLPEIYEKDMIRKLDGTVVNCKGRMALVYIYNDYTNLNIDLIDYYDLDLKIFYNEIPQLKPIIEEIPYDKLYLIINKTGEIIEKSKARKEMVFNLNNVNSFINLAVEYTYSTLKDLKVVKE